MYHKLFLIPVRYQVAVSIQVVSRNFPYKTHIVSLNAERFHPHTGSQNIRILRVMPCKPVMPAFQVVQTLPFSNKLTNSLFLNSLEQGIAAHAQSRSITVGTQLVQRIQCSSLIIVAIGCLGHNKVGFSCPERLPHVVILKFG